MSTEEFDIKNFLTHLTESPGVYRMLNLAGEILYVGKASNLKKRVSSYFLKNQSSPKTIALVAQIAKIEVNVTRSETEALLLESNMIKQFRPKYNILLRDDKSYPFIYVTTAHRFPRMEVMRSKHKPKHGHVYGPYPSKFAATEAINFIQKLFKIRNCQDSFFNTRTRPCLQFQIHRCSAPCVQLITPEAYQQAIHDAESFLQGKSGSIIESLESRMNDAVARLAFEEAANLRDQVKALRLAQEYQGMVQQKGDVDIIVIHAQPDFACIQWVLVRHGEVLNSQAFYPALPEMNLDSEQALSNQVFMAFINHCYLEFSERIPKHIVTNIALEEKASVEAMLTQLRGKSCQILTQPKGSKKNWLDFAINNLALSVTNYTLSSTVLQQRFEGLEKVLGLVKPIQRMECFDISHTQGTDTVASCVVFNENGPLKRAYRQYSIRGITPGDDYAAMELALRRRFERLLVKHDFPDVLLIDGGKGQVSRAKLVLEELGVQGVVLLGISKGPSRKAGWEQLIPSTTACPFQLEATSPALHLLQHIRDEAHRFAINAHREKRQKSSRESSLLLIEGLGPVRKKALITRFGGIRELALAPVTEIAKIKGISLALAQRIYAHFHPDSVESS